MFENGAGEGRAFYHFGIQRMQIQTGYAGENWIVWGGGWPNSIYSILDRVGGQVFATGPSRPPPPHGYRFGFFLWLAENREDLIPGLTFFWMAMKL